MASPYVLDLGSAEVVQSLLDAISDRKEGLGNADYNEFTDDELDEELERLEVITQQLKAMTG